MDIKQQLIPKGLKCRPGIPLKEVTSITIHWIGPYPGQTPKVVRTYWCKPTNEAAAHFIIKDDVCWNTIPITEVAWHCGSKGNYSSIGIEVIPATIEGSFSPASINTLKELLKQLPKVELLRHYDWTQKQCPAFYVDNNRWEALKDELNA